MLWNKLKKLFYERIKQFEPEKKTIQELERELKAVLRLQQLEEWVFFENRLIEGYLDAWRSGAESQNEQELWFYKGVRAAYEHILNLPKRLEKKLEIYERRKYEPRRITKTERKSS